jgi:hypothetical protein
VLSHGCSDVALDVLDWYQLLESRGDIDEYFKSGFVPPYLRSQGVSLKSYFGRRHVALHRVTLNESEGAELTEISAVVSLALFVLDGPLAVPALGGALAELQASIRGIGVRK